MSESSYDPPSERDGHERADPHEPHVPFADRRSEVERPVVEVGNEHAHDGCGCGCPEERRVREEVRSAFPQRFLRACAAVFVWRIVFFHDRVYEDRVARAREGEREPDHPLRRVGGEAAECTRGERHETPEDLRGPEEFCERPLLANGILFFLLHGVSDPRTECVVADRESNAERELAHERGFEAYRGHVDSAAHGEHDAREPERAHAGNAIGVESGRDLRDEHEGPEHRLHETDLPHGNSEALEPGDDRGRTPRQSEVEEENEEEVGGADRELEAVHEDPLVAGTRGKEKARNDFRAFSMHEVFYFMHCFARKFQI